MANISISGTIEVQDMQGNSHQINHDDFHENEHLDGTTSTFEFENDDFSISRIVEKKDGGISWGDWETENCTIIHDNITFS